MKILLAVDGSDYTKRITRRIAPTERAETTLTREAGP